MCKIEGGVCSGHVMIRSAPMALCAYACVGIISLIVIILIAVSFEYVQYNELAFGKNSVSNKVNTEEVLTSGRHFVGPSVSMVRFPKQYQTEAFTGSSALSVFNSEGMEIIVEVHFQYRILESTIKDLMLTYGTNYEGKLRSVTEAILKNRATNYTNANYLHNRTIISEDFNTQVTAATSAIFLNVESNKLQLGQIILPSAQMNKYMEAALVTQREFMRKHEQEAELIRTRTNEIAESYAANATRVTEVAQSQAARIEGIAQATADELVSKAYGDGWVAAMTGLGITESADRAEFLRLMGILDNPSKPQLIDKGLIAANGGLIVNNGALGRRLGEKEESSELGDSALTSESLGEDSPSL